MRSKIIFILLLFYLPGLAQTDYLPFARTKSKKKVDIESYSDITLGMVLKSAESFKANISVNNIVLHRLGLYSSIEANPNDYTNIYGITATINSWAYLFGGIDLFTKHGVLTRNRDLHEGRKEAGVGLTPYKWIVIRVGYSVAVGPTLSAGVKIPLEQLF